MATMLSFLNLDLQQSVLAATLQAKSLLCFVTDHSDISSQWEAIISEQKYRSQLTTEFITLKINAGSQEAEYLHTVCPLNSLPALVTLKRGSIEENLQHAGVSTADLQTKFDILCGPSKETQESILHGLHESVAMQPMDTPAPVVVGSTTPVIRENQTQQRENYNRAHRERESADRAERERIKAQIAADRAERRRVDDIRRQAERRAQLDALRQANSTTTNPQSTDIRIQVRLFDGSTIKSTFPHVSTITFDVRSWIDEQYKQSTPYDLKVIMSPSPVRNIGSSEEDKYLSELGLVSSATLVMVPIENYVESYTAPKSGVISTVTGTVSSVIGGVRWFLGWDRVPKKPSTASQSKAASPVRNKYQPPSRIRTLADIQAAPEKKQSNELYNGNQLSFQGRKVGEAVKKQD